MQSVTLLITDTDIFCRHSTANQCDPNTNGRLYHVMTIMELRQELNWKLALMQNCKCSLSFTLYGSDQCKEQQLY